MATPCTEDETIISENIDRWERFVTENSPETPPSDIWNMDKLHLDDKTGPNLNSKSQTNPDKTNQNKTDEQKVNHLSDYQRNFDRALSAIRSFFIWFSSYRRKMEEKNNNYIQNLTTDNEEESISDVKKRIMTKQLKTFSLNLEKNEISGEDLTAEELSNCWNKCEPKAKILSRKMILRIRSFPYPLLRLYTSQDGMLSWFGRRIPIAYDPPQMRREMQFKEIHSLNEMEQTNRDNWQKRLNEEEEESKLILLMYQSLSVHISSLLLFEFQILDVDNKNLSFISGLLYRGEIMSSEELNSFKSKMSSDESIELYKTFSEGFCSTTSERSVAMRFLSSNENKFIKLLHSIEVVNPSEEEIQEFRSLCWPHDNSYVKCAALDIRNYSEFPNEKEILIHDLPVLGLGMSQVENGVWQVDYVASTYEIYDERLLDEVKEVKMEHNAAMEKYTSEYDIEELREFYERHPDDLIINYFSLLNMRSNYLHCQQYYCQENNNQNSSKADQFSQMIEQCTSHLKLLRRVANNC